MNINKATDIEIMERIRAATEQHEVVLSYANIRVYMSLLAYAQEPGVYALSDARGVRFNATVASIAKYCDRSPTVIQSSIRMFAKCGIIKHIKDAPNPSVILLCREFYEKV